MRNRVGHLCIRCDDLARSLRFYRDIIGLPEAFRMHRADGSVSLVYLHIDGEIFLELLAAASDDPPAAARRIGYDHLCFLYDDLRIALVELAARGLVVDGEPTIRPDGNLKYWASDPDNNRVELTQLLPDSLQSRAVAALNAATASSTSDSSRPDNIADCHGIT
jgi:lactoylglutathione lyase